jgi:hypothetical protein
MSTIHHAKIKSAASKGVILTYDEGECTVTAHMPEPNRRVTLEVEPEGDEPTQAELTERAGDAWSALADILAYEEDHPKLTIRQETGDFVAYHRSGRGIGEEIARDPEIADLFETMQENEHGGEADDDEPDETGSVVPAKYKKEYAERGDPAHCGDWLAITLKDLCRVLEDGKEVTDLDRLQAIAQANDVDPARYGKLGLATNGWQGRFRMTVRNMLTPRVAAKGFLFIPEGADSKGERELNAPRQWCVEHSPKPKAVKTPDPKAATTKNPGAGKASAKTKTKVDGIAAATAAATAAVKASKAKEAARRTGTK